MRDDAVAFRENVYSTEEVQAVVETFREQLKGWFDSGFPPDPNDKARETAATRNRRALLPLVIIIINPTSTPPLLLRRGWKDGRR